MKLHFWKCLEGLIATDFGEVAQYIGTTTVTMPMISKTAKHLKIHHVWEQHVCHLDNDSVGLSR